MAAYTTVAQPPRQKLSEMSEEQRKEIALGYANRDWHIIRDVAKELGLEQDDETLFRALFAVKLGEVNGKAERSAPKINV